MARRTEPDPLAAKIGERIRALRAAAGLTLEGLAFCSEFSKGQLSTLEQGLAVPTAKTLVVLAEGLEVLPLDLLNFPSEDARQQLIELTRSLTSEQIDALAAQVAQMVRENHRRG
jgi:transcriptional regulator with XRE-family HTH domain